LLTSGDGEVGCLELSLFAIVSCFGCFGGFLTGEEFVDLEVCLCKGFPPGDDFGVFDVDLAGGITIVDLESDLGIGGFRFFDSGFSFSFSFSDSVDFTETADTGLGGFLSDFSSGA